VNLNKNEETGWLLTPDQNLLKAVVAEIRKRTAITSIQISSPENPSPKIKDARKLAEQALALDKPNEISTNIERHLDLQGLALNIGNQALFYRGIRKSKSKSHTKRSTLIKLAATRYAVNSLCDYTPTDEQIWKSIRDRNISKSIRNFFYKSLHNTYKVGKYWNNIPTFEHREQCIQCGEEESIEHIITECPESIPIKVIWDLVEKIWKMKGGTWNPINYGIILGCNLVKFKHENGKPDHGKNRLFTILISESAHLIWKIHFDQVINRTEDNKLTQTEIHNKWVNIMNTHLKMDVILTNSYKYKCKATPFNKVLDTWKNILFNERKLPENWIKQTGVLVGIASLRPPGRNR